MNELPASRKLLNITKAALDHCEAECERLQAQNDRLRHLLEQAARLYDTLDRRNVNADWYEQVRQVLKDKP